MKSLFDDVFGKGGTFERVFGEAPFKTETVAFTKVSLAALIERKVSFITTDGKLYKVTVEEMVTSK